MKAAFMTLDTSGDGNITASELGAALNSLGYVVTEEEVQTLIANADVDGNAAIDFPEFMRVVMSSEDLKRRIEEKCALTTAFRMFDQDNNGYITREEIRQTLAKMNEHVT